MLTLIIHLYKLIVLGCHALTFFLTGWVVDFGSPTTNLPRRIFFRKFIDTKKNLTKLLTLIDVAN